MNEKLYEIIEKIEALPDSDDVVQFVDEYDLTGLTTDDLKRLAVFFKNDTACEASCRYCKAISALKRASRALGDLG